MEKATCLCGKVTIEVANLPQNVTACHCSMCRKWGSGPFLSVEIPDSHTVHITPEDAITRYRSSEWAERGFCKTCGSNLFYHLLTDEDTYFLPIDLFPEQKNAVLDLEIFYDRKPAYYDFANKTRKKKEAEIFKTYH